MRKLKIVLVGTGSIAGYHVRPHADPGEVMFPHNEAEFTAVMDVDLGRAQAFAKKYEIPHVYSDALEMFSQETPDIVCIATPPAYHVDLSIRAMEAGAWVLCEKPLCVSLAELDRIAAVEEATGCYCSSVAQFRFGSVPQHLKQIVESNLMGRVLVGTCHSNWYRSQDYYEAEWRGTWEKELGGTTLNHGIHAMDMFLWTMGEWKEVQASIATLDHDIETEDISVATVVFENGALGSVLNSTLCPKQNTYVRYDFQEGTAWTEGAQYDMLKDKWHFHTLDCVDTKSRRQFSEVEGDDLTQHCTQLGNMIQDFHAKQRPLVSGIEARRTIEFISALYKSAATGVPVARGSIRKGDPFYDHVGGSFAQSYHKLSLVS